ncbi:MAG TPA: ParB N-terminal domain-containing protein [Ferrovibrio sp.]|uniref:ParB N-terminal domain-containing protein n=1 Tax=Ferrovibrio sp. TaxID=1917215 RepID=UPI002B4B1DB1|nr:ParB N-terminal domain-containing protein [Ferrovibrio sp.]HLT77878.1 ParB N-terminal domain-containing protein [Ferrovibrio sp.]
MMKSVPVRIDDIQVPMKFKGLLDPAKAAALAEDILANGQKTPIQVRRDEKAKRYVLVSGLHRLEALRSLGEATVDALIVAARKF